METKRKNHKHNIVFTCIIICICVVIYFVAVLLQEEASVATPLPIKTQKPYGVPLVLFLNTLNEYGIDVTCTDEALYQYDICLSQEEDAPTYNMVLSARSGYMYSCAIEFPYFTVRDLPNDATIIEERLYEQERQLLNKRNEHMKSLLMSAFYAMDMNEVLPYATQMLWYTQSLSLKANAEPYENQYDSFTYCAQIVQYEDPMLLCSLTLSKAE